VRYRLGIRRVVTMQEARIATLQRMPIFGGIRADVLDFVLEAAAVMDVPTGEFFFRENDKAQSMFVLETGEAEVLKLWDAQQYLLGRLHAGDCFGEMALMDLFPRSASVRAAQACTAIELSTGIFFQIYEKDLEQFALMQMNIGREVSRRLRVADERLFRARIEALSTQEWRVVT
jgi:CRP/FNR family transcriptional regulator, cyclic AMP receptor protein